MSRQFMRCAGIQTSEEQRLPAEFMVSSGQRIINKRQKKKQEKRLFGMLRVTE